MNKVIITDVDNCTVSELVAALSSIADFTYHDYIQTQKVNGTEVEIASAYRRWMDADLTFKRASGVVTKTKEIFS